MSSEHDAVWVCHIGGTVQNMCNAMSSQKKYNAIVLWCMMGIGLCGHGILWTWYNVSTMLCGYCTLYCVSMWVQPTSVLEQWGYSRKWGSAVQAHGKGSWRLQQQSDMKRLTVILWKSLCPEEKAVMGEALTEGSVMAAPLLRWCKSRNNETLGKYLES